jgi:MarR family transcriptional regulator, organic hydroperoxide resistance regulator
VTDKSPRRRVPPSVSNAALLIDGSDTAFRELISGLMIMAEQLIELRKLLGRRIHVTGPQFGILYAIARMEKDDGVNVSRVAERLRVSGAFVTTEVGKLVRKGLVSKRASPRDRRAVLLTLTDQTHDLLAKFAPELQAINDQVFGHLDAKEFRSLTDMTKRIVEGQRRSLAKLGALRRQS